MKKYLLNLQRFAEGGSAAGSAAGDAGGAAGVGAADNGQVAAGNDGQRVTEPSGTEEPPKKSFKELIKGEYKDEFGKEIEAAIKRRFKNESKKYEKMNPLMEVLGERYGVDVTDFDAIDFTDLASKLVEDEAYIREEAMSLGIDENVLRQTKKLEFQNNMLERQRQEAEYEAARAESMERLAADIQSTTAVYPEFDFDTEMDNPDFARLIETGRIDVRTAYEVIHKDEFARTAMQFAANRAVQDTAKAVASGTRPAEGKGGAPSAAGTLDPSKLTYEQYEEIKRRAAAGEKITF
jgi:hypothetical protein